MNKYSQQQIERIAHKVIDLMKTEKENWFKPFSSFTYSADKKTFLTNQPFNAVSGNNYSGYNVFELSLSSLLYTTNAWVTFKQAQLNHQKFRHLEAVRLILSPSAFSILLGLPSLIGSL